MNPTPTRKHEPRTANPEPEAPNAEPRTQRPAPGRGRPRVLDEVKRGEVCALISGGFSVRHAARYVGCSANTIQRELERNAEFQKAFRRSQMLVQLNPLRAMQLAAATHWRAAAWLLERMFPERFGRRQPAGFTAKQARALLSELVEIVKSEVRDPARCERMQKRITAAVDFATHAASGNRKSSGDLQRAMALFAERDRRHDPLDKMGVPEFDLDALFDACARPKSPQPQGHRTAQPPRQKTPEPPRKPRPRPTGPNTAPRNKPMGPVGQILREVADEAQARFHAAANRPEEGSQNIGSGPAPSNPKTP